MRILIFDQGRALGDGIMFSGIPKLIKELHPDASIDLFCTKTFAQPYINNKIINNIYLFKTYTTFWRNVPQEKIIFNFFWQLPVLMQIRKNTYDIIIDTSSIYNSSNLKMLRFFKKIDTKIFGRFRPGNKYGYIEESLSKIYTGLSKNDNSYEFLGIIGNPPLYDIYVPEANLKKSEEYFNKFKNKYGNNIKIAIFNGEGSGKKTISSNKIIEIISKILGKDKNIFIFFMGYKPCMPKYLKILEQLSSQRVNITYETNFKDACALIKYSDLLISVDTALIHVASAVNTKVVEIYSQNMPKYAPCFPKFVDFKVIKQTQNMNKFDMDGFSTDEVCQAVTELLYQ